MWNVIGIIVASSCIVLFEGRYLLKKKLTRELRVFVILLVIGTGLSIAKSVRIKIPNPYRWIEVLYSPLSDRIFAFFQ